MVKNGKRKLFLKNVLFRFDSECLKRIPKRKSRYRNFFQLQNFLDGDFLPKMTKIVKKWQSQKNLVEKIFLSESIQNVLKRILKRKSRNRKFFPVQNFFVGFSHILPKMTKIVKKLQSQKILVEKNFFGRNRLRMF